MTHAAAQPQRSHSWWKRISRAAELSDPAASATGDIARAYGVSQFEADVLAENTPMLNVLRHSGLRMRESQREGVVHATLFLT